MFAPHLRTHSTAPDKTSCILWNSSTFQGLPPKFKNSSRLHPNSSTSTLNQGGFKTVRILSTRFQHWAFLIHSDEALHQSYNIVSFLSIPLPDQRSVDNQMFYSTANALLLVLFKTGHTLKFDLKFKHFLCHVHSLSFSWSKEILLSVEIPSWVQIPNWKQKTTFP